MLTTIQSAYTYTTDIFNYDASEIYLCTCKCSHYVLACIVSDLANYRNIKCAIQRVKSQDKIGPVADHLLCHIVKTNYVCSFSLVASQYLGYIVKTNYVC